MLFSLDCKYITRSPFLQATDSGVGELLWGLLWVDSVVANIRTEKMTRRAKVHGVTATRAIETASQLKADGYGDEDILCMEVMERGMKR